MTLLLTIAEAAEECRVSVEFIEKEIREKRLAIRKLGRLNRVERTELQRWISELPTKTEGTIPGQFGSPSRKRSIQPVENTAKAGANGRRGHD